MFLILFFVSSQEDNSEMQDATHWIKTRLIAREAMVDRANMNALRIADEELMDDINRLSEAEIKKIAPEIFRYLVNVISLQGRLAYIPNVTTALDILIKKMPTKKYFLSVAGDVNNYPVAKNPFVIAKLLEGYRYSLETDSDDVFKSFERCYRNVMHYRINRVYGYDFIIPDFVAFLYQYISLVGEGKIKDQERIMMSHISFDMQIGKGKTTTEFTKTEDGQKLNQRMFEYLNPNK
jgi:hypothetical protein